MGADKSRRQKKANPPPKITLEEVFAETLGEVAAEAIRELVVTTDDEAEVDEPRTGVVIVITRQKLTTTAVVELPTAAAVTLLTATIPAVVFFATSHWPAILAFYNSIRYGLPQCNP